ncbi:MAG TPA: AgmX/PglI C-terminal domain-containing protein [Myxococcota bacterium]|jgi:hypothetical protein|nr:AgmX/PglI C-terminal domain-containing protein [Myxococcota bacterium]
MKTHTSAAMAAGARAGVAGPARRTTTAPPPMPGPRPAPSARPAADPFAAARRYQWFVSVSAGELGPISFQELQERIAAGEADRHCYGWRDGLADWQLLGEMPELAALFGAASAADGGARAVAGAGAGAGASAGAAAARSFRGAVPSDDTIAEGAMAPATGEDETAAPRAPVNEDFGERTVVVDPAGMQEYLAKVTLTEDAVAAEEADVEPLDEDDQDSGAGLAALARTAAGARGGAGAAAPSRATSGVVALGPPLGAAPLGTPSGAVRLAGVPPPSTPSGAARLAGVPPPSTPSGAARLAGMAPLGTPSGAARLAGVPPPSTPGGGAAPSGWAPLATASGWAPLATASGGVGLKAKTLPPPPLAGASGPVAATRSGFMAAAAAAPAAPAAPAAGKPGVAPTEPSLELVIGEPVRSAGRATAEPGAGAVPLAPTMPVAEARRRSVLWAGLFAVLGAAAAAGVILVVMQNGDGRDGDEGARRSKPAPADKRAAGDGEGAAKDVTAKPAAPETAAETAVAAADTPAPATAGGAIMFDPTVVEGSKTADPRPRTGAPPRTSAPDSAKAAALSSYAAIYGGTSGKTDAAGPVLRPLTSGPTRATIGDVEISGTVSKNVKAIKLCYERALKKGEGEAGGKARVTVTVRGSGDVTKVAVAPPYSGGFFGGCLKDTIMRWRFPEFTGDPVTFEWPIVLESGG